LVGVNVYIGATRQNDGKTITCPGLISAFKKRVDRVGYIKPVGQRYVEVDGHKIRPGDSEKIRAAEALVDEFVDVDRPLESLRNSPP
jgi:BioD-like phosphotransacetylase family protein